MALVTRARLTARFVPGRILVPSAVTTYEDLADLAAPAASGRVTPALDRTFPLSPAAQAIDHLETEHARAKVVITVDDRLRRTS